VALLFTVARYTLMPIDKRLTIRADEFRQHDLLGPSNSSRHSDSIQIDPSAATLWIRLVAD
jgi:hypothetical protein